MARPQVGLQPLIGYAMAALGKQGATPEQVEAKMEAIAYSRGWPRALIHEAVDWALTNQAATYKVGGRAATATLKTSVPWTPAPGEKIGVRVILTIVSDRAGIGRHLETISVVLNVDPSMRIGDIKAEAEEAWLQVMGSKPSGDQFVGFSGDPQIVAVFEGGYESTTI